MIDISPDAETRLAKALQAVGQGYIVVVTGAGISLASGIPTFRGNDPDAVWARDVTELGTNRYFEQDPAGSWSWYLSRFDNVLDKQPNAAHDALVQLEQWHQGRGGEFLLVTQNVDPLHERAGTQALVKVHGSADRARCVRAGCDHAAPLGSISRQSVDLEAFRVDPVAQRLPRCPACGALLRQHVLWFDEYYDGHADYQWSRVNDAAERADLLLFVGTSFAVGVTNLFLQSAMGRRIPALSIDPSVTQTPHRWIQALPEKAEELLPNAMTQILRS
jgi:NAD-dependent deacetylase